MPAKKSSPHRHTLLHDRLTIGLLIAFVFIGAITVWVAYNYPRSFISTQNLTKLPGDSGPLPPRPSSQPAPYRVKMAPPLNRGMAPAG